MFLQVFKYRKYNIQASLRKVHVQEGMMHNIIFT